MRMSGLTQDATRRAAREALVDRQRKLRDAIARVEPADDLSRLLAEVDAALGRMENGTYGNCAMCGEPFAESDLLENPLAAYCLCKLTPAQQSELEADLDLAWRIQAALLPRPDIATGGWEFHYRYQPAGVVSGDYCDVVTPQAPDGDVFFAVGDVSGKGIAAALLMSHLHASFRSHIRLGVPVGELLERANQLLFESTGASQYATLVSGRVRATGEVELGNAGQCAPIRLGSGTLSVVEPTGFPVGMFGRAPYPVKTLWLPPGESLFFYTDGLTEARNGGDEEYGEARLRQVLQGHASHAPRELAEACLSDQRAFRGSAPPSDDLTVMILRRSG
jgi:sigma-B regulation protein RsbU (phosphoserine phosphatase)